MQQINIHKSLLDELRFYKQEVNKLTFKLTQCENKIKIFENQQDKIKELQKINFDTSTRLLQCVSNVRDLLHSNKNLRLELQVERKSKEQAQIRILTLQEKLFTFQRKKVNLPLKNVLQTDQQRKSFLINSRPKNIHKLTKIQKFSKLKLSQNRKSQQNIDFLETSPMKKGKSVLEKLNKNFQNSQSSQKIQIKQRKSRKFVKSLDERKEQKDYEKAQLRRKLSLRKSQNRLQTLQYRPQNQLILTHFNK